MKKSYKKSYIFLSLLLLTGCQKDIDFEAMEKNTAEEIFAKGKSEIEKKNYKDAAKIFEELEKLYPYSKLTADAELLAGDCHYKSGKFDEAISSYEIFVKTHPTNDKVPYAIYMLGLINYQQIAIIERDQEATATALSYFEELCSRYPNSRFVKDSQEKIKILRDQQAGREVYVARYNMKQMNYAGAISRLNTVIELYPDTIHVPEAMLRLVECYIALGIEQEARSVNKLLQQQHKNTKWAEYAKNLLGKNLLGKDKKQKR